MKTQNLWQLTLIYTGDQWAATDAFKQISNFLRDKENKNRALNKMDALSNR